MNDRVWQPAQALLHLGENEIHLWRANLEQPSPVLNLLSQTLSTDERVRSKRYYFERDRRRFIASRGILRMILGSYLQKKPENLKFQYDIHGKPFLDKPAGIKNLSFNMSHSADLAVYAVVRNQAIGVDLEKIRPVAEAEQIASKLFPHWENKRFLPLPEETRLEFFFYCWTRLEAYLKATGRGLSLTPDPVLDFIISDEPTKQMGAGGSFNASTGWSISVFKPAPGFTAALAVKGCGWRTKYWVWREVHLSRVI